MSHCGAQRKEKGQGKSLNLGNWVLTPEKIAIRLRRSVSTHTSKAQSSSYQAHQVDKMGLHPKKSTACIEVARAGHKLVRRFDPPCKPSSLRRVNLFVSGCRLARSENSGSFLFIQFQSLIYTYLRYEFWHVGH